MTRNGAYIMPKGKMKTSPIRSGLVHVFGPTVIGCHPDDFVEYVLGRDLTIIRRARKVGTFRRQPFYIYIAPGSVITYYTSYKGAELQGIQFDIEAERLASTYGRYFRIPLLRDLKKTKTPKSSTISVHSKPSLQNYETVYLLGPVVVRFEPKDFINLTTGRDLSIICERYTEGWKRFHNYVYVAPDTPITYYTTSRVELSEVDITHEAYEIITPRGLW